MFIQVVALCRGASQVVALCRGASQGFLQWSGTHYLEWQPVDLQGLCIDVGVWLSCTQGRLLCLWVSQIGIHKTCSKQEQA